MARTINSLALMGLLAGVDAYSNLVKPHSLVRRNSAIRSSNADMFGGPSTSMDSDSSSSTKANVNFQTADKLRDEAAKLRQEAAELEVALREEARVKGVPEEVINKLMPLRQPSNTKQASNEGTVLVEKKVIKLTANEIRSKLGYLNAGDPIRITSELDRIKAKDVLSIWNSYQMEKTNFQISNGQLTSRTGIQPNKLRLDDVGFDYQRVFVGSLIIATVLGVGSSFIGGQIGFIFGYLSALIPITLLGVGSIAPALIGDVLNRIKYATDEKEKEKYVKANAGKFLVGYAVGLPVSRFDAGSPSNTAEFFQLRPRGTDQAANQQMYSGRKFKQADIAPYSIVCLAASVAECIEYGESSGTNPNEVNTLYELMNAVEPAMSPEDAQSHIRWSAVQAHSILTKNKAAYSRLVDAFNQGIVFEECIAALEATGEISP